MEKESMEKESMEKESMKIKELLELTKEMPLAHIAKTKLPYGEKKVRELLNELGCEKPGVGKSGWTYNGDDPSVLEKDISEFLPSKATPRKATQKVGKEENKQTKKTENHDILTKKPTNFPKEQAYFWEEGEKESEQQMQNGQLSKPINANEMQRHLDRLQMKKVTYEIEEWLHDELRVKAIREKRKVSEIVNELIKKGLAE